MKEYDVIIIGAGPAGLTAAVYAARANKRVAVFEKLTAGGKLAVTPHIENYLGAASTNGYELAEAMRESVQKSGAEMIAAEITKIDLSAGTLSAADGKEYGAKAVILATGARSGKLGIDGEKELLGSGLSYCAVCDGAFFRGKTVVLVGGCERTKADLKYLSGICKKVWLISPTPPQWDAPDNVETVSAARVTRLIGNPLSAVEIESGAGKRVIEAVGIFVDTALKPDAAELFDGLDRDENGFIITDGDMRTNISGVYAAGDVRSKTLRQVVTAASDGAIAASSAVRDISKKKIKKNRLI